MMLRWLGPWCIAAVAILAVLTAESQGVVTATEVDGAVGGGPSILEATYRLHPVDVLNTRHEHGAADQRYTAQHGGDTSSWSYDTAVVSVAVDDALYLNGTSLLDVQYFVSLAPANRQILYGLTRLVCPGDAAHPARVVESFPTEPLSDSDMRSAAMASGSGAANGSSGDAAAEGIRFRDAYDAKRSVLHQSGLMLWPLSAAAASPFTWLHALSGEDHTASAAASLGGVATSGYRSYNRLEWALLLGYTTPAGERHTFLDDATLATCRIEFLPKHAQRSEWFAAQELTNRAGEPLHDAAPLTRHPDPPKHHRVVSQHSDDVSFLEERSEVGGGLGVDVEGIPGLSALISALVDEVLGPDVKRVADFVTVRLDHRLLGLLAKYVGGSEIPGVYKLWNLLQIDQTVTPYTPKTRPTANANAAATANADTDADDADGDADDAADDSDGDSDSADDDGASDSDGDGDEAILLDLSAPTTGAVATAAGVHGPQPLSTVAGVVATNARGGPLTDVQRRAAARMASPDNPLNHVVRSVPVSLGEVASSATAHSAGGVTFGAVSKQSLRELATRFRKWRGHTSLPLAFVPRFPQVFDGSRLLGHGPRASFGGRSRGGARAQSRGGLRARELDEPDGIMTRNLITSLAKLLSVTVSVALTESLVESLNEDMRDLILPPLREYLPVRMTPIVTRGLVQPLVIALTETITNGVERVVPGVVLSRLKHTLVHTLTRGITHSVAPALMYTLRDASHLEPVCYSCYYVDRSYCDMCSYLRRRQDRLAPAYHDLYYLDYFVDYYSDWYADWFTYGINPKDPPGTFSDG